MDIAISERLFQRRRFVNALALVLSGTAALVGLFSREIRES